MKLIKFPLHSLRSAVAAFNSTGPVFCEEMHTSCCVKSILTHCFGKLTEEEKMYGCSTFNYENCRKFSKRNLKTIVALVQVQNCVIKIMI
jgi:hypothetical protein